jgi:restriction system protein
MAGRREELAKRVLWQALKILDEEGGELDKGELKTRIWQTLPLDDWDKKKNKSGIRWVSALEWYSNEYVKAGFMWKDRGTWHITERGKKILSTDKDTAFEAAREAYNQITGG